MRWKLLPRDCAPAGLRFCCKTGRDELTSRPRLRRRRRGLLRRKNRRRGPRLLSAMPQPPQLGVLPDADTASLMSSCGGNLDQTLPEMCLAVSPSRRKAVQAKMAAESAAFFLKYLGTPNPPPLPPEPEDNPQITSHPATPEKNAARKKKR